MLLLIRVYREARWKIESGFIPYAENQLATGLGHALQLLKEYAQIISKLEYSHRQNHICTTIRQWQRCRVALHE